LARSADNASAGSLEALQTARGGHPRGGRGPGDRRCGRAVPKHKVRPWRTSLLKKPAQNGDDHRPVAPRQSGGQGVEVLFARSDLRV